MKPRRRQSRAQPTEPAIIAQANPTPEQRARFDYFVGQTVDPYGETVVQGKVRQHSVCVRQPTYLTIVSRKGMCERTRGVLDWYDRRLGLARKGLTTDSLARALQASGGGRGYNPTEAAMNARDDVDWARSFIKDPAALKVFDDVMEHEMALAAIGGGHGSGKERASTLFTLAANWVMAGVSHRVLEAI